MILHLYVGDLQVEEVPNALRYFKIIIIVDESREIGIASDTFLSENIVRFNQMMHFPVDSDSSGGGTLNMIEMNLVSVDTAEARQVLGYASITATIKDQNFTKTLKIRSPGGITIASVPVSIFYNPTAISDSEKPAVKSKKYKPNLSEFSFLLARKFRAKDPSKPVSFDATYEQRVNDVVKDDYSRKYIFTTETGTSTEPNDLINDTTLTTRTSISVGKKKKRTSSNGVTKKTATVAMERPNGKQKKVTKKKKKKKSEPTMTELDIYYSSGGYPPQQHGTVRKKKRSHSAQQPLTSRSVTIPSSTMTLPVRSRSPAVRARSTSPARCRETCMSVGYVKNKWPEPGEGEREKSLYRMHLASERRLEILRDMAEEVRKRNRRTTAAQRAIKRQKEFGIESKDGSPLSTVDNSLKNMAESREHEVDALQRALDALKFVNATQSSGPSMLGPGAPSQYNTRSDRLAKRILADASKREQSILQEQRLDRLSKQRQNINRDVLRAGPDPEIRRSSSNRKCNNTRMSSRSISPTGMSRLAANTAERSVLRSSKTGISKSSTPGRSGGRKLYRDSSLSRREKTPHSSRSQQSRNRYVTEDDFLNVLLHEYDIHDPDKTPHTLGTAPTIRSQPRASYSSAAQRQKGKRHPYSGYKGEPTFITQSADPQISKQGSFLQSGGKDWLASARASVNAHHRSDGKGSVANAYFHHPHNAKHFDTTKKMSASFRQRSGLSPVAANRVPLASYLISSPLGDELQKKQKKQQRSKPVNTSTPTVTITARNKIGGSVPQRHNDHASPLSPEEAAVVQHFIQEEEQKQHDLNESELSPAAQQTLGSEYSDIEVSLEDASLSQDSNVLTADVIDKRPAVVASGNEFRENGMENNVLESLHANKKMVFDDSIIDDEDSDESQREVLPHDNDANEQHFLSEEELTDDSNSIDVTESERMKEERYAYELACSDDDDDDAVAKSSEQMPGFLHGFLGDDGVASGPLMVDSSFDPSIRYETGTSFPTEDLSRNKKSDNLTSSSNGGHHVSFEDDSDADNKQGVRNKSPIEAEEVGNQPSDASFDEESIGQKLAAVSPTDCRTKEKREKLAGASLNRSNSFEEDAEAGGKLSATAGTVDLSKIANIKRKGGKINILKQFEKNRIYSTAPAGAVSSASASAPTATGVGEKNSNVDSNKLGHDTERNDPGVDDTAPPCTGNETAASLEYVSDVSLPSTLDAGLASKQKTVAAPKLTALSTSSRDAATSDEGGPSPSNKMNTFDRNNFSFALANATDVVIPQAVNKKKIVNQFEKNRRYSTEGSGAGGNETAVSKTAATAEHDSGASSSDIEKVARRIGSLQELSQKHKQLNAEEVENASK